MPAGGRLGIYGFGASAHLTAQLALAQGNEVHVLTRSAEARRLATELGATSVGGATDEPPVPLDAAMLFAPVGELVSIALAALDRGGTLAVAGIHLTDIPAIRYDRELFQEKQLRSVTANTRDDGEMVPGARRASRRPRDGGGPPLRRDPRRPCARPREGCRRDPRRGVVTFGPAADRLAGRRWNHIERGGVPT